MLWLADNGDNSVLAGAQRPQESALNSPPTVETLQTVLGDGLPAAVQKLIKGLLNSAGAERLSERRDPHLHLRLVRRSGGGTPGALVARRHQGGRHGRRRSERRRPPARGVRSTSCSTARAAATACPPRTSTRCSPPARADRHRDLGLHAGVPPGGARPRRAGRGNPAAADRVARVHAAPRARAQRTTRRARRRRPPVRRARAARAVSSRSSRPRAASASRRSRPASSGAYCHGP